MYDVLLRIMLRRMWWWIKSGEEEEQDGQRDEMEHSRMWGMLKVSEDKNDDSGIAGGVTRGPSSCCFFLLLSYLLSPLSSSLIPHPTEHS